MLEHKRRKDILNTIRKNEFATVEKLSKDLGVSAMTIRRDLSYLSENGFVERCRGGATLKMETPYKDKKIHNAKAKIKIAERAASFVKSGDSVFLDAGTTTFQIAKLLSERDDLTFVTIDIEIAHFLRNSKSRVIVCGGEIQKSTNAIMGYFANNMLNQIRLDIAFIGVACIDSSFSLFTPTSIKAELKNIILDNSSSAYVVADSSKFNKSALVKINNLSNYSGLITDYSLSEKEQQYTNNQKINVIHV